MYLIECEMQSAYTHPKRSGEEGRWQSVDWKKNKEKVNWKESGILRLELTRKKSIAALSVVVALSNRLTRRLINRSAIAVQARE